MLNKSNFSHTKLAYSIIILLTKDSSIAATQLFLDSVKQNKYAGYCAIESC